MKWWEGEYDFLDSTNLMKVLKQTLRRKVLCKYIGRQAALDAMRDEIRNDYFAGRITWEQAIDAEKGIDTESRRPDQEELN